MLTKSQRPELLHEPEIEKVACKNRAKQRRRGMVGNGGGNGNEVVVNEQVE